MKISVLGCGKMMGAIAKQWSQRTQNEKFIFFNPTRSKAEEFASWFSQATVVDHIENTQDSDVVVLGFKPQNLTDVASSLKIKPPTLIVSILAGVSCQKLAELLGTSSIVRMMPNTPLLIGEGHSLVYYSDEVEKKHKDYFQELFESFSSVTSLTSEKEFDVMTSISGSGPGYIFDFAHHLESYLINKGYDIEIIRPMVKKTLLGSAQLLSQSDQDPATLRDQVTSKKGITEAIIKSLNWKEFLHSSLDKGYQRAQELGKQS